MKRTLLFLWLALSLSVMGQEEPSVAIEVSAVTETTVDLTFTPNEACAKYYFVQDTVGGLQKWLGGPMAPPTLDSLVVLWGIQKNSIYTHHYTGLKPGKDNYIVYVRSYDENGNAYPLDSLIFSTPSAGGVGLAHINIEVSEITDTTARIIATPNDQTAMYRNGLVTKNFLEEKGIDSVVKIFQSYPEIAPYIHYTEVDDWVWPDLESDLDYVAIALGTNGNGEWGDTTIVEFRTLPKSGIYDRVKTAYSIYPQPSNGQFTFESPEAVGKTLVIMDTKGVILYEEKLLDTKSFINVTNLVNGIYFVYLKGDSVAQKIVITK